MKNHVKTAIDTLTGLGFRLDHEDRKLRTDRWVFTHANEPDARLTLNFRMSEPAARTVIQRAKQIVGMASTETSGKERRARVNGQQKAERAAERARREAARSLAEARRAEREAERARGVAEARSRELDGLIRGRDVGVSTASVRPDAMLTAEQAADETGVSDAVIASAIQGGRLEAYQCGKEIKVKGRDLRAWVATWQADKAAS